MFGDIQGFLDLCNLCNQTILMVSGKMIHRTDESFCAKRINQAWKSLTWGGGGGGVTRNFIKWTLNGVSHYLTFAPLNVFTPAKHNPKCCVLIAMTLKMIYFE